MLLCLLCWKNSHVLLGMYDTIGFCTYGCQSTEFSTMGKRSTRERSYDDDGDNDEDDNHTKIDVDVPVVLVVPGDCISVMPHVLRPAEQLKAAEQVLQIQVLPIDHHRLGRGLRYDPHTKQVYATCSGRLVQRHSKDLDSSIGTGTGTGTGTGSRTVTYHVESHRTNSAQQRKYRPTVNDRVIGIVMDRIGTTDEGGGDLYRIHINAAQYGLLNNLQFNGATKRNKPMLQSGQILYCRVMNDTSSHATAIADEPILLSCTNGPYDVGIPNKDWSTKESCYGELRNGGTLCRISMQLARDLLSTTSTKHSKPQEHNIILDELAKQRAKIPFEVAIGVNGYLWINSDKAEYIVLIQNAIQNSNVLTAEQTRAMVKNLIYVVEKQLQQRNDAS
jgi:exosome complex component RRP40